MKKLLLAASLCFFSLSGLWAQVTITCTAREVCNYNETTNKFDNCETLTEASTFKLNSDETEIIHTTPTKESTYTVNSSEYTKRGIKIFAVTSEVGNNYVFVYNKKKKDFRILTFSTVVLKFIISDID